MPTGDFPANRSDLLRRLFPCVEGFDCRWDGEKPGHCPAANPPTFAAIGCKHLDSQMRKPPTVQSGGFHPLEIRIRFNKLKALYSDPRGSQAQAIGSLMEDYFS